jgi:hypothetical protein
MFASISISLFLESAIQGKVNGLSSVSSAFNANKRLTSLGFNTLKSDAGFQRLSFAAITSS